MLICRLAPVAMALCAQAALLPPPAVRGEPLRLERTSRRGVARAAPCMTTRPQPRLECKDGVCILMDEEAAEGAWSQAEGVKRRGVCTYWNQRRGYGFVAVVHASASEAASATQQAPSDVFVHNSDLHMEGFRRLYIGEEVEFELARHEATDKVKAAQVHKVAPERIDDEELDSLLEKCMSSEPAATQTTGGGGGGNFGARLGGGDGGDGGLHVRDRPIASLAFDAAFEEPPHDEYVGSFDDIWDGLDFCLLE